MDDWLNLSEAAEALGVHPATVRAWADRGDLPSQRTPGGHRRFRRSEVEARAATLDRSQRAGAQLVIQAMVGRARLQLADGALGGEAWYQSLSDNARRSLRPIGYRLLHLVQAALGGETPDEAEAQAIGQDYARLGRENGLSLTDTTRAYLYFRGFVADAIFDMGLATGAGSSADWTGMHRRAMNVTDDVLLALIESARRAEQANG